MGADDDRVRFGADLDPDIARMARFLVERHGEAALAVAEERLRTLEKARDHGAAAVWREIADLLRRRR